MAVLLLLVGVIVWVGARGLMASNELKAVVPLASQIQGEIGSADTAAASTTAASLAAHASKAAELTSDPIWRAAEVVPWAGGNLAAVREMSTELDRVASQVIVPLAGIAGSIDTTSLRSADGRIDLAPLVEARPVVGEAVIALEAASARIDAIDADAIIGPIADARSEFADAIDAASEAMTTLDRTVRILPEMLGADGPRNYLILFQNSAELRTGGGIIGALALVHTEDGRVTLIEQAASGDIGYSSEPVLPLPEAETVLFGNRLGTYIQNVTATPDFSLSGRLAAAMWARDRGTVVDGVIAVDPVGLSYVLGATGPVAVAGGGTLSEGDAVRALLVDTYERLDDDHAQDAFFASAAGAVFGALSSASIDPAVLIAAVTRIADEHRLAIWSAHDDEQAVLADTTLAGMQATQTSLGEQAYAVYLNDRSGGKMDAYLDVATSVEVADTRDDGRSEVELTVTMTSTAPPDAAVSLPRRTTNGGMFGVPPGVIATNVTVYSPPGAFDAGVSYDGAPVGYQSVNADGRIANNVAVDLAPGATATVVYRFVSAEPGQVTPVAFATPLMTG
ncbi:hypothetical protein DCE93_10350 [Agromyces badenianii]|uniref:DUF4012 domain-containing protein n=1 Tax=Agromyces badenianii TaxID=2080742 RepID=A0A2S0WXI2_9MICO|nr:DUF4012 domain-containing protein [Agromyces badenianii]AWB96011.1 hypothetical protein DCE93_10350 [Agromyces badenianii]